MKTYWLVNLTPGGTSPSLKTLADVAVWIENAENVNPDKVRIITVKKHQVDDKRLVKEAEKELAKLEERMATVKEKLERIKKD